MEISGGTSSIFIYFIERQNSCGSTKKVFVVLLYLEDLYGDFEDLETGEFHRGQTEQQDPAEVSRPDLLPLFDRLTIKTWCSILVVVRYSLDISSVMDAVF